MAEGINARDIYPAPENPEQVFESYRPKFEELSLQDPWEISEKDLSLYINALRPLIMSDRKARQVSDQLIMLREKLFNERMPDMQAETILGDLRTILAEA